MNANNKKRRMAISTNDAVKRLRASSCRVLQGLAAGRDGCWNRTGPCFLDHKPRNAWQRFGSFRYASLVVFRSAACGSKKRDRNRDGYFAVEVTHAVNSHSVCSRMRICVVRTIGRAAARSDTDSIQPRLDIAARPHPSPGMLGFTLNRVVPPS